MKNLVTIAAMIVLGACSKSSGSEQTPPAITNPDIQIQGQQSFIGTTWCGPDTSESGEIKILNFYQENGRIGLWRDWDVGTETAYAQRRVNWDMFGSLLTVWWADQTNAPYVVDAYVSYQKTGDTLQLVLKDEKSDLISVYSACQR